MKPVTPTALVTGTVILAVVCAAWLSSLSCRPVSDSGLRPPAHAAAAPKA